MTKGLDNEPGPMMAVVAGLVGIVDGRSLFTREFPSTSSPSASPPLPILALILPYFLPLRLLSSTSSTHY